METEARIVTRTEGAVGIIELARPQVFNCLSVLGFEQLKAALHSFETDRAVRVILILAQGKHFCTGAELGEVKRMREDRGLLAGFLAAGHETLASLEACPLPVIAAVQGLCLAGGLELALACDVVFAARSARFGDQHAQYGLAPGWGGSQRLPRIVGLRRALDLMFSARWIDAQEAERWGLVNRVVTDEELAGEALKYGAALAERSAPGIALMKRLTRDGLTTSLESGLRREMTEVLPALLGDDVTEGLAAFEARRTPRFAGR